MGFFSKRIPLPPPIPTYKIPDSYFELTYCTPCIYIFVRQDISIAQQVVQSNHATLEAGIKFSEKFEKNETPSIILIGLSNKEELEKVAIHLMNKSIKFATFFEPDNDMGLSAITTDIITKTAQRKVLSNYLLWVI